MSDFNKMIDEQLELQGTAESTHRILEAMLKRDQLEIEYRQQGISESKIAEFHEAATAAISEGLLGSMKDKFAGSKAGHALGMKSTAEKEKEAKDGKWYNKVMAAVVAAYEKFIAWVKKVWVSIQAFFMKETNFIAKYEDKLNKHKGDKEITEIKISKVVDFDTKLLEDFKANADISHWENLTDRCKKYEPVDGEEAIGNRLSSMIEFFKKGVSKDTPKQIEEYANEAKTMIQSVSVSDDTKADRVRRNANAYLRFTQAFNDALLRERKAKYKAYKSGILKAIAVINSIKESTINFMVEACNTDVDKTFAPIMESSDMVTKCFDEGVMDKFREKFGKGKKEETLMDKAKGAGKTVWAAIASAFNSLIAWAKKVWYSLINLFNNNKEIIRKYGDLVKNAKSSDFKGIKVIEFKDTTVQGSTQGVLGKAKDKSVEQWEAEYEKYTSTIETEDVEIASKLDDVIEYLSTRDISAMKKSIADATSSLSDAQSGKGDPKLYKAYMKAFRACTARALKIAKMKLSSYRSAFMKCVAIASKHEAAFVESFNENYCIEVNYEIDGLLLEGDVVDEVIDKAVTGDAQGVTDVNLASTEVIPQGASTDPFALDYEDKNCFSQTVETGDEGVAGTVGAELGDTETSVKAGNETPSVTKEAAEFLESLAEIF